MKAPVLLVMEFAALVSVKTALFHEISKPHLLDFFRFIFQLLLGAEQRLLKIAPISNPLELKVEHVG